MGKVGNSQVRKVFYKNGTKQGAVSSPAFWAVYCDLMIKELRELGVGAHVAGIFMGIACYADDVVLIAPCRQAMQLMLDTVERFARVHNITFSTDSDPRKSKSKCIYRLVKGIILENHPLKCFVEIICPGLREHLIWDMNCMKVVQWIKML